MIDTLVDVAAVSVVTKVAVDLFQLAWPQRPSYVPPLAALVLGLVFSYLVHLQAGQVEPASIVLTGVLAAGAAVGITEVQSARRRRTSPEQK